MTDNEANELRLIAAEIIHKLWRDGQNTQLELLMVQAKWSLQLPFDQMINEDEL